MRLIDADELAGKLKGLKERIDKIEKGKETRCLVDVTQVIEYVENAPTVEAITNEGFLQSLKTLHDSNQMLKKRIAKIEKSQCPNCGAKMTKGGDDECK